MRATMRGRPRQRPDCVMGDRGYDAEAIRLLGLNCREGLQVENQSLALD
jgi:hypothetical protein